MAKKKKTRRDTAELARDIVEQVTGGKLNGDELDEHPDTDENAKGRKGGLVGGKARAEKLTAEQRSEIAKKAAQSRWGKNRS